MNKDHNCILYHLWKCNIPALPSDRHSKYCCSGLHIMPYGGLIFTTGLPRIDRALSLALRKKTELSNDMIPDLVVR